MGLISKIEDKLTGSSNNEEQNKLQKSQPDGSYTDNSTSNYSSGKKTSGLSAGNTSDWSGSSRTKHNDSGAPESVRHPISSTGDRPTGTAVDNSSSNPTTSTTTFTTTTQHGTQGAFSAPGGYTSTSTGDSVTHPTTTTSDRNIVGGTTAPQSQTYRQGPRQPFDPYSIKGQQTAADAATNPGDSSYRPTQSQSQYTGSRPVEIAPGITKDQQGNVLKSSQGDPTYARQQAPQTTSDHHYGRDAGIVGGTGAAGIGAYEMGKHSGTTTSTSRPYDDPTVSKAPISSHQAPIGQSSGHHPEQSYASRDTIGGPQYHDPNRRPFVDDSAGVGGAGALGSNTGVGGTGREESTEEKAKKMADAYQAGYRDGVEHMRAEMQKTQLK